MPDLTIETAWTCSSNEEWETTVAGSKGETHTVRFSRLYGRDLQLQRVQYGYTCDCKGFQFRGHCHHVDLVMGEVRRCGWNAELEPTAEPAQDESGEPCCPVCGGPVSAHRVGV